MTLAGGLAAVEPGDALPVTNLSQLTTAFEGIVRAGSLSLYEGLPHPTAERELFQREKNSQEIVQFGGEPFYQTPLEVKPGDEELLRRFCSSAESFAVYSGPKRCGGFHADYCLQWQEGDVKWQVLVCFGCQEVKFYGPDTALRADVGPEVFKRLQALLGKYRAKRPDPQKA
ncbi:MAG: hypothetical protein EOP84_06610 [Verrucomicrobiaceae bacterium]|nr:MAG: hypothetical protein EOP84_06610 [Verrucomicrobiaceae bacterium]